ncbi:MAG: NUDIX hydrolase [Bacilli bacterium]|jgi:ADP-ribose pyrophosphatase YjhB (NUDIX family)|nr:NUDIX hydrolase [Bacilli bacterium]MCH4228602.1 NUDIX hydrolase [Bacilli bacterium]MCH4277727.1 NUDIX hydrolase [Bacilli bacterium]
MDIEKEVEIYVPFNEQEAKDKTLILDALKNEKDIFKRTNVIAHMTASAWVVNPSHDKVLMVYHNIYQSWSWLGGHADGDTNLLDVAIREVKEESGVTDVKALSKDIFSLEVLTVDGHIKRGQYVSSHLHLNVSYLLEVDDKDPLFVKPDENSGVRWFTLQGAIDASTEPWFKEHVYSKLNQKLALFLAKK